jgi:hypothetical protein
VAEPERQHRGRWALLSLVPFGFGTGPGFAYAARHAGIGRWHLYAGLYLVLAAGGFVLASTTDPDSTESSIGGSLLLVPWIVGVCHSFIVRGEYLKRVRSPERHHLTAARSRLQRRDDARELVERDARLAREMGIGRPDRDPQAAAGLVDMNSAPAAIIARLPGVDDTLADQIVSVRQDLDGFSSVEDLGMTLNLSADLVEDLREWVVFLPR